MPLSIFISHAPDDDPFCQALDLHLANLKQQGQVEVWSALKISGGEEPQAVIIERLRSADLVVLLVSADFMNSKRCMGVGLGRALERHEMGAARVMPVIVRPCHWRGAPFAHLEVLPNGGQPVNKSEGAWLSVVEKIAGIIESGRRSSAGQSLAADRGKSRERRRYELPLVLAGLIAVVLAGWGLLQLGLLAESGAEKAVDELPSGVQSAPPPPPVKPEGPSAEPIVTPLPPAIPPELAAPAVLPMVVARRDDVAVVAKPGSTEIVAEMDLLRAYYLLGAVEENYQISSQPEEDLQGYVQKRDIIVLRTRKRLHVLETALQEDQMDPVEAWESVIRMRRFALGEVEENTVVNGPSFKYELREFDYAFAYPLLDSQEIQGRDGTMRRIHQVLIPEVISTRVETSLSREDIVKIAGAVTFCLVFDVTKSSTVYAREFDRILARILEKDKISPRRELDLVRLGFVLYRTPEDSEPIKIVHPRHLMEITRKEVTLQTKHGEQQSVHVLDAVALAQKSFSWDGPWDKKKTDARAIPGARRIVIVVANGDVRPKTVGLGGVEADKGPRDVAKRLNKSKIPISVFTLQAGAADGGNLVHVLSSLAEKTGGEFFPGLEGDAAREKFADDLEEVLDKQLELGKNAAVHVEKEIPLKGHEIAPEVLDEDLRKRLKAVDPDFKVYERRVLTKAWIFDNPALFEEKILKEEGSPEALRPLP